MSAPVGRSTSDGYGARLMATTWQPLARLLRPPQVPPDGEGARLLWRQLLLLNGIGIVMVLVLMVGFDAAEIGLMPPRGTPSLWWVRILTDSVWVPAANTTRSWLSTSGSTYTSQPSNAPSGGRAPNW